MHAEDELDAVAVKGLAERLPERRRLAGEHTSLALDQYDLTAEAAHHLRELEPGRSTAEHDQPFGYLRHPGRLARAPDAVELSQTRNRRDDRIGAVGQHHVLGRVPHPVDLHYAGPGDAARPAQQVDAMFGEPALLAGVGIARDHEVSPRERGREVDLRVRAHRERAVHRLAGAQQRLRRDARPVGALTADQLALDDGHAEAAFGERAGGVLARGAAPEHDHVVVPVRRARHPARRSLASRGIWAVSSTRAVGTPGGRPLTGAAPS